MPKEVVKWGKQYTLAHNEATEDIGEYWYQTPLYPLPRSLSKSDEVRIQQEWLNDERDEDLNLDGKLGPRTTAAIERYQEFLGVKRDGIWGPETDTAHIKYFFSKYQPTREPNLEVIWTRPGDNQGPVQVGEDQEGWVQVGLDLDMVDLKDKMRYDDETVTAKTFYTDKLTRRQINDLIRTLKRARAAAFGEDE